MIILLNIALFFGIVRILFEKVSFIVSRNSNGCGNALINFIKIILLIVFVTVTLIVRACFSCYIKPLRMIDAKDQSF